jgi:hypothetical protein
MRSSGVPGVAVDLAGIARVGVHEDELADVVQQRRDHQAVAVLVAGLGGERSAARCVATPCRRKRSGAASQTDERSKKSKVRAAVASAGRPRARAARRLDDRLDLAAALALDLVAEAQHGDDQRDVALDGGDDVAGEIRSA